MVKLKEIFNLILKPLEDKSYTCRQYCVDIGYNKALSEQGEKSISLDRKKLLEIIKSVGGFDGDVVHEILESIIANLKDIIIVNE